MNTLLLHVLGQRPVAQRFAAVAKYRGPVSLHQTSKRTGHIPIGDETDHITIGICCVPCTEPLSHILGDVGLRVRPHNSAEFNHIGDVDSTRGAAPRRENSVARAPARGSWIAARRRCARNTAFRAP